jgi:hypothetical protein
MFQLFPNRSDNGAPGSIAGRAAETTLTDLPDLVFLALAQYQLGGKEPAQATLVRLREAAAKPQWATDPKNRAFLREAETPMETPPATKK